MPPGERPNGPEPAAEPTARPQAGPPSSAPPTVPTHTAPTPIGPHTAVGRDCLLSGVGIRDSNVLDGASIDGIPGLHGSLIGRCADIRLGATSPHHRLLVGDHSHIALVASAT